MIHIFMNSSGNKKDPNITYLIGYSPEFCILVYDGVSRKKCMFVIPFELEVYKGVKCISFDKTKFKKQLLNYFNKKSIKTVGLNKSFISLNEFKNLKKLLPIKYVDNSKLFLQKRKIKSKKEIFYTKKACNLTDKIFSSIVNKLKKGILRTEKDVEMFIKKTILELGVEIAFNPIVATGTNSSKPHHIPTTKNLSKFTVMDFGVKYNNYCSDLTRTIYVGSPAKKEIEMYKNVLSAYDDAFSVLKVGTRFKEVDFVVRKRLGKNFVHSLGHGVGVEVHELPILSPSSKDKLDEGMVFTIEPGVYFKGNYGVRFENTVAFSENKLISLTNSPKNLIVVKKK